jgi:hypothetical protein
MPFLGKFASGILTTKTALAKSSRDAARVMERIGPNGVRSTTFESLEVAGRMCGAPGCTSGWMKPWKNRRRPVFEEEWGCSARCLQTMVGSALARVMGDRSDDATEEPHRHRVPLGLVLLAQGWITHPQLQTALAAQRATGEGRIGDWLTRSCGLAEDRIARGLGVQWNCPVLTLQGFSPRAMAMVMPKRFVAEFGLIPVRAAGSNILYVAFQERLRSAAALGVEQMCGLKVESGLLTTTQLESARTRLLAAESVPVRIRLVNDTDALTSSLVKLLEQRQPVASRLVRIHQYYWMRMWMEEAAMPGIGGLQGSIEDTEDHIFMVA